MIVSPAASRETPKSCDILWKGVNYCKNRLPAVMGGQTSKQPEGLDDAKVALTTNSTEHTVTYDRLAMDQL